MTRIETKPHTYTSQEQLGKPLLSKLGNEKERKIFLQVQSQANPHKGLLLNGQKDLNPGIQAEVVTN